MKKNILLTGSAGFILGNYIRRLVYLTKNNNIDYNISSVDIIKSNTINSIYKSKNHSFHIADLTNKHTLDIIFQFEKPDIVIHGAAQTLKSSLNDYVDSNITATQNILEVCSKYNVEKFIHMSDTCIDSPTDKSFYKTTKNTAEDLVKIHSKEFGLKYNVLKIPNVYGPRQHHSKFIPALIKKINNNEDVHIFDDGTSERDWVHVFDVCSALNLILSSGKDNETYSIHSGNVVSNIQIVYEVAKHLNKNPITVLDEKICSSSVVDNICTMSKLGWKPELPFTEGIGEYCIEWYLKNNWFFNK